MYQSVATCLLVNCCFNLEYWSSTKQTSSSSHQNVTYSQHDIADNLFIWIKQQSLIHSPITNFIQQALGSGINNNKLLFDF